MFNKFKTGLKEDIQKQFNEFQESMDKKLEKTQKQLNELKEVTSK
jgi:dihydroxyacetone kinase-like predicted kinase